MVRVAAVVPVTSPVAVQVVTPPDAVVGAPQLTDSWCGTPSASAPDDRLNRRCFAERDTLAPSAPAANSAPAPPETSSSHQATSPLPSALPPVKTSSSSVVEAAAPLRPKAACRRRSAPTKVPPAPVAIGIGRREIKFKPDVVFVIPLAIVGMVDIIEQLEGVAAIILDPTA